MIKKLRKKIPGLWAGENAKSGECFQCCSLANKHPLFHDRLVEIALPVDFVDRSCLLSLRHSSVHSLQREDEKILIIQNKKVLDK